MILYMPIMRQRLGYESTDKSHDDEIMKMSPRERVRLIAGWYLGEENWANEFEYYFESQGLYLTTEPDLLKGKLAIEAMQKLIKMYESEFSVTMLTEGLDELVENYQEDLCKLEK